jgi:hypothetical protein
VKTTGRTPTWLDLFHFFSPPGMINLKYAVGLDLSKDDFKACFSVINTQQHVLVKASKTFANTPAGFSALSSWVAKQGKEDLPIVFVMEATGVYHEALTCISSNVK